ncbi:hypothetical protein A9Q02_20270 [Candidatus Chloroploca asiatica]|uniref:Uncharacterized protein n=1 Tax=Candidatus Chloroploca asiatica TaxID=1506545 RepID=A0A2H3KNU1_9CHLR|nr:hypothetical protein A9Q02_20270 [Candidatus Chloroploca asiatica]
MTFFDQLLDMQGYLRDMMRRFMSSNGIISGVLKVFYGFLKGFYAPRSAWFVARHGGWRVWLASRSLMAVRGLFARHVLCRAMSSNRGGAMPARGGLCAIR